VVSSPCTELDEPVSGEAVAGVILGMAHGERP
jgi:hypothetical protein